MKQELQELKLIDKEIKVLCGIRTLLSWDQETFMPEKSAPQRGEQAAIISKLIHAKVTGKELKKLVNFFKKKENNSKLQRLDRLIINKYDKAIQRSKNISQEHVEKYAQATTESFSAWDRAKKTKKFATFAPHLKKIIALKKKEAQLVDKKKEAYDIFLDDFEEGMTQKQIDILFEDLKPKLQELIEKIRSTKLFKQQQKRKKTLNLNIDGQKEIVSYIKELMQFEDDRVKVNESTHPFTCTINPDDVRFTVAYSKDHPFSSYTAAAHEGGHALYELGFDKKLKNTLLYDAPSMAIHESQSRFWENHIAKNKLFLGHMFPKFKKAFKKELKGKTKNDLFQDLNIVSPSLIRIEADEITYAMHIIIRYELEKELLKGRVRVEDLPMAWKAKYRKYLGIVPANDAEGVLQDIHWANGYIGYFPTYLLGSIYASMIFAQAKKELAIEQYIKQGEFKPIIKWLREHIHRFGSSMTTPELIMRVCKKQLNTDDFVQYLKDKYYPLYGIKE